MARIMAIDYGTKRSGIAVTDPSGIIANALTTVHTKDLVDFLKRYFASETVSTVVVGEPKTLDNKKGKTGRITDSVVRHLERVFPAQQFERIDERFTSSIAADTLRASGLKKKDRRDKSLLDSISATLILQSYLEQNQLKKTV